MSLKIKLLMIINQYFVNKFEYSFVEEYLCDIQTR